MASETDTGVTRTAVPLVDDEGERALLRSLVESAPAEMLMVSDLHLGSGRDSATGRFSRAENFLAGEDFSAMLEHLTPSAEAGALLVLNGDNLDFLRIAGMPDAAQLGEWRRLLDRLEATAPAGDLALTISRKERAFGLRTDDFKSVWKVARIVSGHDDFFRALAAWIAAGGRILFVKGNHDVELHWPLVRRALRDALVTRGAADADASRRVFFCEDWLILGNVYIEHGHRFEAATAVDGPATLPGRPTELNLPLGSFVNRYLINPVERYVPFVDNVKPVGRMLRTMVRKHPLTAFGLLWRSWRFLLRAAQASRFRQGLAFALFFGALAVPLLTLIVVVAAFLWPAIGGRLVSLFGRWNWLLGALGFAFPWIVGVLHDLIPPRRPAAGEDHVAAGLYRALLERARGVKAATLYGVLGHTHAQDVQKLPPVGDAAAFYVNTGTWIAIWPEDRLDLAGRTLHPIVRFARQASGEYRLDYLEWRCLGGRTGTSVILGPAAGGRR